MLKVAICDDDLRFVNELLKLVKNDIENTKVEFEVMCFINGQMLLEAKEVFDLYFLDIEMPEICGFEIAEKIRKENGRKPDIVFVTAHDNAVYDVFEYEAVGFVRKSNLKKDLEKTISSVLRRWQRKSFIYEIKSEGSLIYKSAEEMIYAEVYSHKLVLHCFDGDYSIWGSLDELEEKLSEASFIRTHRCFLVNPKYIKKIERKTVFLEALGIIEIPFSKHKATEVKKKYFDYKMNL